MTPSAEQTGVRDLYARRLDAWNARDAGAFAACYAPDGITIGFDGSQVACAAEIREHLATIFADHQTAPYVAKLREIRPLGADVALLRAIVGMVPPGSDELSPAANAAQSLVAARRDAGWSIVLFQNTPAQHHGRP